MKDGDYQAACASFEVSLKLEHTIGTSTTSAWSQKIFKLASAWADSSRWPRPTLATMGRAADAAKRVASLEPR